MAENVLDFTLRSEALDELRKVSVFLPPRFRRGATYPVLFCADGQAIQGFSHRLARTMEQDDIPPSILIGAHSSDEYRVEEYIDGVDDLRFEAHERFFVSELSDWSRARLALTLARDSCGVFGFSNGAALALSLAVRHREQYGVAIAFSIAGGPHRVEESQYAHRPIAKYYLASGTREKPFCRTGRAIAEILDKHGVEHALSERCAGHDFDFWDSELPEAIRWSFPRPEANWLSRLSTFLFRTS